MKRKNLDYSYPPWLFCGEEFTSEMIGKYYGFVYCITNKLTGKKYIGRKYFYKSKSKTVKNRKRKKRVINESDWKTYWGSSLVLQKDVERFGTDHFTREIVSLHITKGDTNYFENLMLFRHNVLEAVNQKGERMFYNDNIMNRYYARSMDRVVKNRQVDRKFLIDD
ncbi:MAG: NAD synthetase [Patescibacteria group bacterium]|nr:NAD synthetase [Patescibacteria group bacterium]